MPADIPGGDFSSCVDIMMDEGHDEESAEAICGALEEEAKSDLGDPEELLESLRNATGMILDGTLDLVSGVDVPAIDSKWVMMKSDDDDHDWQTVSPILLEKQEGEEKRISFAPAMIPRQPDKEGEVVPTPTVEKMAHGFLSNSDAGIDTDHSFIDGEGTVVESWILKEDRTFDLPDGGEETYPAGTWMLGIKWEAGPWERIKEGELTGLSIYGMAEHVRLQATTVKTVCESCGEEAVARARGGERTKASARQGEKQEPQMPDPDSDPSDDEEPSQEAQEGADGEESSPDISGLADRIDNLEDQVADVADAVDTVEASVTSEDGDEGSTESSETEKQNVNDLAEAMADLLDVPVDEVLNAIDDLLGDDEGEEEEASAGEETSSSSDEETAKHRAGMGEGTRTARLEASGSREGLTSYQELAKEEATE